MHLICLTFLALTLAGQGVTQPDPTDTGLNFASWSSHMSRFPWRLTAQRPLSIPWRRMFCPLVNPRFATHNSLLTSNNNIGSTKTAAPPPGTWSTDAPTVKPMPRPALPASVRASLPCPGNPPGVKMTAEEWITPDQLSPSCPAASRPTARTTRSSRRSSAATDTTIRLSTRVRLPVADRRGGWRGWGWE